MDLQKKIYNYILDFWKLIKLYTPAPDKDDIAKWDKLTEDAGTMLKKYEDGTREYKFFKNLLFAWFDYIGKE